MTQALSDKTLITICGNSLEHSEEFEAFSREELINEIVILREKLHKQEAQKGLYNGKCIVSLQYLCN